MKRGDRLYVEGRLHFRSVLDEDEAEAPKPEIVAESIIMLGRRQRPASYATEGRA